MSESSEKQATYTMQQRRHRLGHRVIMPVLLLAGVLVGVLYLYESVTRNDMTGFMEQFRAYMQGYRTNHGTFPSQEAVQGMTWEVRNTYLPERLRYDPCAIPHNAEDAVLVAYLSGPSFLLHSGDDALLLDSHGNIEWVTAEQLTTSLARRQARGPGATATKAHPGSNGQ